MNQEYTGKLSFYPDYGVGTSRLLVAVACLVEQIPEPIHALVDTGGEWCILPVWAIDELELDLRPEEAVVPLSTRFGTLFGRLDRIWVRFDAREGEPLDVQTTCFVCADWPGPMVIGWRGCLQWMRFGLDPAVDTFYFAGL